MANYTNIAAARAAALTKDPTTFTYEYFTLTTPFNGVNWGYFVGNVDGSGGAGATPSFRGINWLILNYCMNGPLNLNGEPETVGHLIFPPGTWFSDTVLINSDRMGHTLGPGYVVGMNEAIFNCNGFSVFGSGIAATKFKTAYSKLNSARYRLGTGQGGFKFYSYPGTVSRNLVMADFNFEGLDGRTGTAKPALLDFPDVPDFNINTIYQMDDYVKTGPTGPIYRFIHPIAASGNPVSDRVHWADYTTIPTAAWNSATAYNVGDSVYIGIIAYMCTQAHTNIPPAANIAAQSDFRGTHWVKTLSDITVTASVGSLVAPLHDSNASRGGGSRNSQSGISIYGGENDFIYEFANVTIENVDILGSDYVGAIIKGVDGLVLTNLHAANCSTMLNLTGNKDTVGEGIFLTHSTSQIAEPAFTFEANYHNLPMTHARLNNVNISDAHGGMAITCQATSPTNPPAGHSNIDDVIFTNFSFTNLGNRRPEWASVPLSAISYSDGASDGRITNLTFDGGVIGGDTIGDSVHGWAINCTSLGTVSAPRNIIHNNITFGYIGSASVSQPFVLGSMGTNVGVYLQNSNIQERGIGCAITMLVGPGSGTHIVNNLINAKTGTGSNEAHIVDVSSGMIVSGNTFNMAAPSSTFSFIRYNAGSSNSDVFSNTFTGPTTGTLMFGAFYAVGGTGGHKVHDNTLIGSGTYGIALANGSNNKVYRNKITNGTTGRGLYISGSGNEIYCNILIGGQYAMELNGISNSLVAHNTIYGTGGWDGIRINTGTGSAGTIRNNVIVGFGTSISSSGATAIGGNNWCTGTVAAQVSGETGAKSATGLFVTAGSDFNIPVTSPLKDAGVIGLAVTQDYIKSSFASPPSIGAYEYVIPPIVGQVLPSSTVHMSNPMPMPNNSPTSTISMGQVLNSPAWSTVTMTNPGNSPAFATVNMSTLINSPPTCTISMGNPEVLPTPVRMNHKTSGAMRMRVGKKTYTFDLNGNGPIRIQTSLGIKRLL